MSETFCELCELPLSTCVHGRPPVVPTAPVKRAAAPRKRAASTTSARGPVVRRRSATRTAQADFRPHIQAVLRENDGALEADLLMDALAARLADDFLPEDLQRLSSGEIRWRQSVRFERKAMTDDGLMHPPRTPGVWELNEA